MTQRLGQLLQQARERHGLSLYALAEQSGVDRSLLWRIEKGETSDPRPENLSKVANVLGLSLTDLYASAGYAGAQRLPNMPAYLRAKYGHLPPEQQQEVVDFLGRLETEYGPKPTIKQPARRKRGGHHGNDHQ